MKKLFVFLIFLSFLLAACDSSTPTVVPTVSSLGPSASPVEASSTAKPPTSTPSATPSASPMILPSDTHTPLPSPTATLAPISLQNADELRAIRTIRTASYQSSAWSPNGAYFVYTDGDTLTVLETGLFGIIHEQEFRDEYNMPVLIRALEFLNDDLLLVKTQDMQVLDVHNWEIVEMWPFASAQLGNCQELHLSPDGKLLAIRYGMLTYDHLMDGYVEIWSIETKRKLATLDNGVEFIRDTGFSPDSKWFGMLGETNGFVLFSTETFRAALRYKPEIATWDFAFHPDNTQIYMIEDEYLVANDQKLISLNIQSGKTQKVADLKEEPNEIIFSPDGSLLAVANETGKIYFLEPGNATDVLSPVIGKVNWIADFDFQPSGEILSVAGEKKIYLVAAGNKLPTPTPRPATNTPTPTNTPPPTGTPTPRPTGTSISVAGALSDSDDIPVITSGNAAQLQHIANFVIGRDTDDVFWSPDGTKLMFTNLWEGVDVYTFSYEQALLQNTLIVPAWDTFSFAISPDGAKIAKRTENGQFEIFDATSDEALQTVGEEVNNQLQAWIAWSPQMDALATVYFIPMGWSNTLPEIRLYNLETGEQEAAYSDEGMSQTNGLTFSPGGTLIAASSTLVGDTYVWNRNTGGIAFSLYGDQPVFSVNGGMIATRGLDVVMIYSTADASRIVTLDAPLPDDIYNAETAFNADGSMVVTTGSDLSFWNIPDGTFITRFESNEPYTHAAFSPDGKLLVTIRGEEANTRVIIWAVLP